MDGIEKSEDNMEALRNDPNETIHKYFFKKGEEIIELVNPKRLKIIIIFSYFC